MVVIDIQNDTTKNCKEIIGNINRAVDWAARSDIHVVYIKHNNLSDGTRTFKPDARGAELAPDLKIVSENIFIKTKGSALASEGFAAFVSANRIRELYISGADAAACVKSTCCNMARGGLRRSRFVRLRPSYDKSEIEAMLEYYKSRGCAAERLDEAM